VEAARHAVRIALDRLEIRRALSLRRRVSSVGSG
ncbi:MAG: hypothetical protein QOD24_3699, partial [Solirubrobacteraceae bacterium]|nr:hypothetical protein [Solirubrobacteraceae bacterium]